MRRLVSIVAVALMAVACGPAPAAPSPTVAPPAQAQPTAAPAAKPETKPTAASETKPAAGPVRKFKISHTPSLIYLPAYIAQQSGEFAAEGLEAEFVVVAGGAEATAALLSGSVEFAAKSIDAIAILADKGQGTKAVVGLQKQPTFTLVIRKDLDLPRGNVQALKGKNLKLGITTPGSGTDVGLRALLKASGLDAEKDVTIVSTRGVIEMVAALQNGSIDGFFNSEPGPAMAIQQGLGKPFVDYRTEGPESLRKVAFVALQTSDQLIQKDAEFVQKVVRAVVKAEARLASNPDIAIPAAKQFVSSSLDEALIKLVVEKDKPFLVPEITPEYVANLISVLKASGQIKTDIPYEKIVATQFTGLWKR